MPGWAQPGVDPCFSTFFGGNQFDAAWDVTMAPDGGILITGRTGSPDLPVTAGAFQSTFGGDLDGYLAKFAPDGSLVFATYLGGNQYEKGIAVVALPDGRIALTGRTLSPNFPTTADAHSRTKTAGVDAYVTVFSSAGSLLYSTLLPADTRTIWPLRPMVI